MVSNGEEEEEEEDIRQLKKRDKYNLKSWVEDVGEDPSCHGRKYYLGK